LDKPTFQNLVGRIEHVAQMGMLVTHFTLIKPGALHKANGGYNRLLAAIEGHDEGTRIVSAGRAARRRGRGLASAVLG
jgi:hypothetical protein